MTIIAGYREACECARTVLEASSFSNSGNAELFRRDLLNIAQTTLSSKILTGDKEHFANLAVDAIMRLKGEGFVSWFKAFYPWRFIIMYWFWSISSYSPPFCLLSAALLGSGNLEAIHIIKKPGGTLKDSYLDEGYILDKKIGVGQVGGGVNGQAKGESVRWVGGQ